MTASSAMAAFIAASKVFAESEDAAKVEIDEIRKGEREEEERIARMNKLINEARENNFDFTVGDNSDYIGVSGSWDGVNLELLEYESTNFMHFMSNEQAVELHAKLGEILGVK